MAQSSALADLRPLFARLLAELPDPYSRLLGLVELEGVSLDEAAETMGLSPASGGLLYSEARRRFRDVVARHTEPSRVI